MIKFGQVVCTLLTKLQLLVLSSLSRIAPSAFLQLTMS